ncbi:MAG: isopentenyl phosphate kinase [Methanobacteriota archaeon]
MYLIKIGGSVLTDKRKQNTFKQRIMHQLATEITQTQQPLILIHGAGSYGHILAKHYRLNQGCTNKNQLNGAALTQANVHLLNHLVLKELHKQNIPAISLPPHTYLTLNNHRMSTITYTFFDNYLKQGFTPITYGDVVLDKTLGFSICSGDLLIETLAKHFKPEKIIFVIDEDGLYTTNPKQDPHATLIKTITEKELKRITTTADKHADVTEGMKGKINTIQRVAHMGIPTVVVNGTIPKRLSQILRGKEALCTNIHGTKP